MKAVEIPSNELKTALTGLGKVVSKRSVLPVLQSIKVTRDNLGIVSLQGTDLDSWATYKLNVAQEGDPVEFLVPIESLSKASKTTKDKVALYPEGKEAVIMQTFLGSIPVEQKVESVNPKEWPAVPEIPSQRIHLGETFRNTMKEAWECASEDESRYVLNSVFLDVKDPKAHYLVSTNGRALFSANSFNFDLKESLMIPTRKFLSWNGWWQQGSAQLAIKPGEKAKDPKDPKSVDIPGWLQFSADQWSFITKQIDGEYPNWKQVIPETAPKTIIRIDEKAIPTMLELVARLPGDYEPNYPITLHVTEKKLLLEGMNKGQDKPASVPIEGVTIEGEPIAICLNRHYLAQALRCGLNEIHLIDELSSLLIKSGGKRMIIMPLRPDCVIRSTTPAMNTPPQDQPQPANETTTTPPAEPVNPAAVTVNNQPNERKDTTTMTTTKTTNQETETKPEVTDSPMKAAMQQIDTIKDNLRSVLHQLSEVIGVLKAAEKEKRATEKEIDAFREKLREIQSVRI